MSDEALDKRWQRIRDHYFEGELDVHPAVRMRLSPLDRAALKPLLRQMYDVLGARTFRERRIARTVLIDALGRYAPARKGARARPSKRDWWEEVASLAEALVAKAEENPAAFESCILQHTSDARNGIVKTYPGGGYYGHGDVVISENNDFDGAIARLKMYARNARVHGGLTNPLKERKGKRRPGRKKNLEPVRAIWDLEVLYTFSTGRYVGLTVDDQAGTCHGPAVDFMEAFWGLVDLAHGCKKRSYGRDAIGHHIRKFRTQNWITLYRYGEAALGP